jgi:PIN domain nuclease of toxin-antitoxin system
MKYLVDTNIVIHLLAHEKGLSRNVMKELQNTDNEIILSSVVLWEIIIKQSLHKLTVPKNYYDTLVKQGYTELPVTHAHVRAVEQLPPHHKDPFDRLLIAQAMAENLPIITHDEQFAHYNIRIVQ